MTALVHDLGLGRTDVVAVAGAGGKTTLVYRLAREAREAGLRVLVTTTTHMGTLPEEITGPVIMDGEDDADRRIDVAVDCVPERGRPGRGLEPIAVRSAARPA